MKSWKFALLLAGVLVSFAMVPAEAQTRILPLGDSVTSSIAPYSSYRYWLWKKLVKKGFDVDFVGTQHGVAGGEPDKPDFDQDHEGHAGWTTQDALANIDAIAAATQPDIVLLDLGSNDIENGVPLQTIKDNLRAIIERLRAFNPEVTILLAQPAPYIGPNSKNMSKLKGAVGKLAERENRRGSRVIKVNLFGGFKPRKDTYDGVHPDESGELKIAKKYNQVLKKRLS